MQPHRDERHRHHAAAAETPPKSCGEPRGDGGQVDRRRRQNLPPFFFLRVAERGDRRTRLRRDSPHFISICEDIPSMETPMRHQSSSSWKPADQSGLPQSPPQQPGTGNPRSPQSPLSSPSPCPCCPHCGRKDGVGGWSAAALGRLCFHLFSSLFYLFLFWLRPSAQTAKPGTRQRPPSCWWLSPHPPP